VSLGTVFYEPLWLFCRGTLKAAACSRLIELVGDGRGQLSQRVSTREA
jgi:hypothetical protein